MHKMKRFLSVVLTVCMLVSILSTGALALTITPKPDSMLRVFMAYQALEEPIEIEAPTIKPFEREGFCVVEWGGAKVE